MPSVSLNQLTVVVMAKPAVPGQVKTRLMGHSPAPSSDEASDTTPSSLDELPGLIADPTDDDDDGPELTLEDLDKPMPIPAERPTKPRKPTQTPSNHPPRTNGLTAARAAAVHQAMFHCVLDRLSRHLPGRKVLALATPLAEAGGEPNEFALPDPARHWDHVDQGVGDLGQRLERVWRTLGQTPGPVAFFGVDSPDVPIEILKAIPNALDNADAAAGPVDDGGYWTLAAKSYQPTLVRGIDWGSTAVYHQTGQSASEAGLTLQALPSWHDVDHPADLTALLARLDTATEPALRVLRSRLRQLTSPTSGA